MSNPPKLSIDFETFSEVNIKNHGSSRYSRDPSTRVLLLGFAMDDSEVEVIRMEEGHSIPKYFWKEFNNPLVQKWAWNASFEMQIFQNVLKREIKVNEWRDTMVAAMTCSFPGKLKAVGPILNMASDISKMDGGDLLVKFFCTPRKATKKDPSPFNSFELNPEKWEKFVEYNRLDVVAERAIRDKLWPYMPPEHEWANWHLDQKINQAGIPVNLRVVDKAIALTKLVVEDRMDKMREITGLSNPNSTQQLLPWLNKRGYKYADLQKGHVSKGVAEAKDENVLRVLEMRQEISKSSVKKYASLKNNTDEDGMLRNTFQFAGAQRTWRWAGRVYQPQNLARPIGYLEKTQVEAVRHLEHVPTEAIEWLYPKPMDLLVTCVRPVVQAPPGYIFGDCDLNAIENRVLGWVADEQKMLDVFREGRCPYVDFAQYMFHVPYEKLYAEYKAGDKAKRTIAKPGVLGCGYRLSAGEIVEDKRTGEVTATGLLGYAWSLGVKMTPEEAQLSVQVFRERYDKVVKLWHDLDSAVMKTIKTRRPTQVGVLRFDIKGPFLRMELPSGRYLHYYKPRIETKRMSWGKDKDCITYEGLNDKKKWGTIYTHGGKLTENAVQAIARDILANGLRLCDKNGLSIRLHVHDQIVALLKEEDKDEEAKVLQWCMTRVPKWAPGLILGAEAELMPVFMKT